MTVATAPSSALLTIDQVVVECGISRRTVYRLIKLDLFPAPIKVGLRAVRWRPEEIEEWKDSRPQGGSLFEAVAP